ncbi:MAG TPA: ISNCY family transposase [Candidatus Dormibacteraeota bacterium]|nr:ISNCY family transposase [Candidatus Dormibacteraeota bacterium]
MKEGNVTLSTQEQRRLMVLNQLGAGAISSSEAASLVGLSERQLRRLRRGYEVRGAEALAHGNRGRRPANAVDPKVQRRVVALATSRYQGFNHQHLTEMLAERERIHLSRPTVHRILAAAGVQTPRKRRPPRAHRRRDRFPREGMLLQIDGSRHDWLEGRGPWLSLVGAIDDATGLVPWACFREQEDAQGYFELIRQTVQRKGVPLAIYADRHGIFFRTPNKELSLAEQFDGRQHPTQFGRLLEELGIQLLLARSPQAKGRIERLWGTFQDRLTSELRLAGATTREHADQVLARFLPRHNRRFTVPANDPTPAWLPSPDRRRHEQLFCFKYRRVVSNDHTVRFGNRLIDIPPGGPRPSYARAEVELQERFDGTLAVYFRGTCLTKCVLPIATPSRVRAKHSRAEAFEVPPITLPPALPAVAANGHPAPAPSHPWRTAFSKRQRNRTKSWSR